MAELRREPFDIVPGLAIRSTCGAVEHERRLRSERVGDNLWHLAVCDGDGIEAELELQVDGCGAWVTVATTGPRPVVVRAAGWVELRGQRAPDPLERWDRVGLGPGDALVVPFAPSVAEEDVLTALVGLHAASGEDLSRCVPASEHVVLHVPVFAAEDGVRRASEATGLPESTFAVPLHTPGSPDAELWKARPAPPMEARMRLPPVVDSVPTARGLLRRLMSSWRMPELLDDVLELLANEVLTNAVVHAGTDLVVVIRYDGASVRFEVQDHDPAVPAPLPPTDDGEGGRGLWMVATLAARWGIDVLDDGRKAVWFEVAADGGGTQDAVVIAAHAVLTVARRLQAVAEQELLPSAADDDADLRPQLREVIGHADLVNDLLTDLVQGLLAP